MIIIRTFLLFIGLSSLSLGEQGTYVSTQEYITGATVFLDVNANSVFDINEPSVISGVTGHYVSDISVNHNRCFGYAPIVVLLPNSNIDDAVNSFILKPVQADLTLRFKSTLVKTVYQQLIQTANDSLLGTCDNVRQQSQAVDQTLEAVEDAINHMVQHYNLSSVQLSDQLAAKEGQKAQKRAQVILNAVVKSVADSIKLKAENPNSQWAQINYHQFDSRDADDRYKNAWYQEKNIGSRQAHEFHLQKMEADLTTPVRSIIFGRTTTQRLNGLSYNGSVEFESRLGDSGGYACDIKETLSGESEGIEYEIVNLVGNDAMNFNDCRTSFMEKRIHGRYLFANYSENGHRYATQFYFEKGANGFSFLNNWQGFLEDDANFSIDTLKQAIQQLPYKFGQQGSGGAQWWVKTDIYLEEGQVIQVQIMDDNQWRKSITQRDGTQVEQCSGNGKKWRDCR